MIRQSLLLAACALAPFVITGCADDKAAAETAQPAPVAVDSPAPAAADLGKELAALAARIRTADASLDRVVGDSATDPEDRLVAFNKSVAAIGPVTATSLAAKLKSDGEAILSGWQASLDSVSDAEMRKVVAAGQAEAKTRFAELDKALRGADAALAYHTGLLRDVRAALGSRPNSSQLVAARPVSKRVTEAGNKVVGWLNYAAVIAKKAGAAPLPAPVTPAPKAEESHSAPEAPATPVAEKTVAPAPAPVASPTPPPAPAPVAPAPEVKPAPVAKPAEPAEPKPTAQPDPVPEPVDA